jgi:D-glycero-alpha-D-manno-heptose-7-phosphate kinase
MSHFISAENRDLWKDIIGCARSFIEALKAGKIDEAVVSMNRDSTCRKQMTPDVFDDMGESLATAAKEISCGVRFTGAGGGGCVWAIGKPENISRLKGRWKTLLKNRDDACLLEARIDTKGLMAPDGISLTD